jgi:hypothetical protein
MDKVSKSAGPYSGPMAAAQAAQNAASFKSIRSTAWEGLITQRQSEQWRSPKV